MILKKFNIHFSDEAIEDLKRRLSLARRPPEWPGAGWTYGADADWLRELAAFWQSGYDWRKRERELNEYPQFICDFGELKVHFLYARGSDPGAPPLLLTHGWPDSFLRYIKVLPLLSDHDLVVPSLPGFAFSTLPPKGFLNNAEIAEFWHRLMTEVLGYREYIASGGDVGRGVTHFMALNHPEAVRGIHLTDVGLVRGVVEAPDRELSDEELEYKRRATRWAREEGAYIGLQASKPQTLAWSLADSPVGMAAWMGEKFHAWSQWELLRREDVLDNLTLHYLANSAATSVRVYHGNVFTLPPLGRVTVPAAVTIFPHEVLIPPRGCIERSYQVAQYSEAKHGGHFTAMENPEEFAESLLKFAKTLR